MATRRILGRAVIACLSIVWALLAPQATAFAATTLVGSTSVLGTQDNNVGGVAEAFQNTALATGTVNQITVYVDASNVAKTIVVGLYADAAGSPGTLLTSGTISSPTAKAWATVNVNPVNVTQGKPYWLALLSPNGGGIVRFRDKYGVGISLVSASSSLSTLPASWASGQSYPDGPISMAALGTTATVPTIAVAPTGFTFHAYVGQSDPAPGVLNVSNSGTGTLNYTVTTTQSWLGATPASATAPAAESVQATVSGLAAGTYSGNVVITASGATNSPLSVPVSLVVDNPVDTSRDWPMAGQNNQRTSFAANDTSIDHTNVASLQLKWSANLDGKVSAQPLFLGGVTVGGVTHDVVLAASNQNSLYAFDADTGATLWRVTLGVNNGGSPYAVPGGLGIRAAPAVDRVANRIYVAADNGALYTLSLSDGSQLYSPLQIVDLTATNKIRGGLNLFNGTLYIATGSDGGDTAPWRGRVYAVDVTASPPALKHTFDVVPSVSGNNRGGGIWSYGGVSIDPATGNVYAATGNDYKNGTIPYSRQVLALSPGLTLLGNYAPPAPTSMGCDSQPCDADYSATPTVFTPTGCPTMVAAGSKDGTLYVIRAKDFGTSTPLFQGFQVNVGYDPLALGGVGGIPAFWPGGNMLFITDSGPGANGLPAGVIALQVSAAPACQLSVAWSQALPNLGSAQSSPTVVGDVVLVGQGATGEVHAYYAPTGQELWNSGSTVTGNTFAAPTVGGGKVFVGSWIGTSASAAGVVRAFAFPVGGAVKHVPPAAAPAANR